MRAELDAGGAHAPGEITIYLGGNCTSFTAVVGIDDEWGDAGSGNRLDHADWADAMLHCGGVGWSADRAAVGATPSRGRREDDLASACYTVAVRDPAALAALPHPELTRTAAIERGIAASAAYLASDAALTAISLDPYWPKWDGPWWHMLLLHEVGETGRIPRPTAEAMAAAIDRLLHVFPIHPGDAPAGYDPHRDVACHCALGCMLPVLAACGIDVDRALPWVKPWFARYQMADGGLTCDERAYLVTGECPSSMVGTVAPFEAMLLGSERTAEQRAFLDRAASFLIERALVHGSPTVHNAAERDAVPAWRQPCFPRFYYYDVLRGLAALVRWAEATGGELPRRAIAAAVDELVERSADGVVHVERRAHAGMTTIVPGQPGQRHPASSFPLLEAVSTPGEPSPALTRQWSEARRGLLRLAEAGRLVE